MRFIGIDISKDSFTVSYGSEKNSVIKEFKNDPKGIKKFIATLQADDHCVMEATGNYSVTCLYLLEAAKITVSMENPLKIKNFAKAMLSVTKTDRSDARLIALYGERMRPEPYKIPSKSLMLLKQKRTVLRQLKKQLVMNTNLQKSIEALPVVDAIVKSVLKKSIVSLEKNIAKLEKDLANTTDEVFSNQLKLLTSIKGIGISLATALIIGTGAFTNFDNSRQLTRYLGLSPTYEQSGTSVNYRGHINRNGDAHLRGQLYVAAWSASQHNTECNALYKRLKDKGKPGKVIMIAVANKLLRQAFAVIKSGKPYTDGFISEQPKKLTKNDN